MIRVGDRVRHGLATREVTGVLTPYVYLDGGEFMQVSDVELIERCDDTYHFKRVLDLARASGWEQPAAAVNRDAIGSGHTVGSRVLDQLLSRGWSVVPDYYLLTKDGVHTYTIEQVLLQELAC